MTHSRREFLAAGAGAVALAGRAARAAGTVGAVAGEPLVDGVGARVLADGGNAVDAVVAAALAGAVVWPFQTGIGGYGAFGVFAVDGGRRVAAIDANSAAPGAATPDMFAPGGTLAGRNNRGWIAAGVPGLMAGVQAALDEFGTWGLADVLRPAIGLARAGFAVPKALALQVAKRAAILREDPGSARLYLPAGEPLREGAIWRNPELADLLETLAAAGSVEPFYRGAIADHVAAAFARHEGLVTKADMAAYRARIVPTLSLPWHGHVIHTAPLTAGGASVLQMLRLLDALDWERLPIGPLRLITRLEAMRVVWRDRLALLGDPAGADVPQDRLLSADHAAECAARVEAAVRSGRPIDHGLSGTTQGGTLHFSGCDGSGNFAALTLTHGESFGACVTVEGLGLTLGHGMSRFDADPDHPNCPGPAKRPLTNMCPTILARDGRAVAAVGGRGGRRIPNALLEFLVAFVDDGATLADAITCPRLHTEGRLAVEFEDRWPAQDVAAAEHFGYETRVASSAVLSAVAMEGSRAVAAIR